MKFKTKYSSAAKINWDLVTEILDIYVSKGIMPFTDFVNIISEKYHVRTNIKLLALCFHFKGFKNFK